jgi:hypothetical protein
VKRHTPAEREAVYWARVDKRGLDECWPWRGMRSTRGRPRIFCRPSMFASHVALHLAGRDRPSPKHCACHTCDNAECVNPAHLWWGTQQENVTDCVAKGRKFQTPFRSHCKYGHPLTGDNIYVYHGMRWCLECRRRRTRESYLRTKEKSLARA